MIRSERAAARATMSTHISSAQASVVDASEPGGAGTVSTLVSVEWNRHSRELAQACQPPRQCREHAADHEDQPVGRSPLRGTCPRSVSCVAKPRASIAPTSHPPDADLIGERECTRGRASESIEWIPVEPETTNPPRPLDLLPLIAKLSNCWRATTADVTGRRQVQPLGEVITEFTGRMRAPTNAVGSTM